VSTPTVGNGSNIQAAKKKEHRSFTMNITKLALVATFILSPVAILAQSTTPAPTSATINQRK
jgi:hypothetical protein